MFIPATNVTYSLTWSVLSSFNVWSNWINRIGFQHIQIIVIATDHNTSVLFLMSRRIFLKESLHHLRNHIWPKENANIIKVYYLVTLQLDSISSFSISNRPEDRLYSKGEDIPFKRSKPIQNFAPISSSSLVPICSP